MAKTTIPTQQVRDDNLLIQDLYDFAVISAGSLDVTIQAGRIRNDNVITEKIAQTITVANNSTSYVEIDGSGVASSNTVGFTAGSIPLAVVVSASGVVTSITEKRTWVAIGGASSPTPTFARTFLLMGA